MSGKAISYMLGGLAAVFIGGFLGLVLLMGGAGSSDSAGTQGVCSQATVNAAGQPPLTQYYVGAANKYKLGATGYAYLAAINKAETSFGTNMAVSSAGAVGWMQFEPATFKQYAVSVSDPGQPADSDDPQDAIYTAAHMLNANDAPGNWNKAIYAYNHAGWYVQEVEQDAAEFMGPQGLNNLAAAIAAAWSGQQQPNWNTSTTVEVADPNGDVNDLASACGTIAQSVALDVQPVPGKAAVIMPSGVARPPKDAPTQVQAMIDAGDRITGFDYQWGGGHANPAQSDSQTNPDPQGGTQAGQDGTPGYDCSGSTDYVLWGGGYGESVLGGSDPASDALMSIGVAGPDPKDWVTWWATDGHVFISLAGIVLDTVHNYPVQPASPSTGPRWQPEGDVAQEQSEDGPFAPRHLENV